MKPIPTVLPIATLAFVSIFPVEANDPVADASRDRTAIIFDGKSPNRLACDTTLRAMPDGSWVTIMLGGGDVEPLPQNRVFLSRSRDEGKTWSPMMAIDLGVKAKDPSTALVPSELMVHGKRCTMFVATHDGTFANWKEWMTHSDVGCVVVGQVGAFVWCGPPSNAPH